MIVLKGYKNCSYKDLQSKLHTGYVDSEKTLLELAVEIKVKTPATVQNAFNTDRQAVSDEVMTNVMKALGLNGFVVWVSGERYYYVKSK